MVSKKWKTESLVLIRNFNRRNVFLAVTSENFSLSSSATVRQQSATSKLLENENSKTLLIVIYDLS